MQRAKPCSFIYPYVGFRIGKGQRLDFSLVLYPEDLCLMLILLLVINSTRECRLCCALLWVNVSLRLEITCLQFEGHSFCFADLGT